MQASTKDKVLIAMQTEVATKAVGVKLKLTVRRSHRQAAGTVQVHYI